MHLATSKEKVPMHDLFTTAVQQNNNVKYRNRQ